MFVVPKFSSSSKSSGVGATGGIVWLNIWTWGIILADALTPGCCPTDPLGIAVTAPMFLLYNISVFSVSLIFIVDIIIYYFKI